ncbi:MAG: hypothetical protein DHS20C12_16840 [Pseudohongiella sp.]|nr:MAG: hypothetical protein DHS20C12_16840 [Pseudohongiella sp.]
MHKYLFAGLAVSLVAGLPSLADTEFEDSIPIDVAEVLFDSTLTGQIEIFSDLIDDFPPFTMPDDFSVIGSVVQSGSSRVVLSTNLPHDQALQQLQDSFEQEGWLEFPNFRPPVRDSGFVAPVPVIMHIPNSFCHDDFGRVSISSSERGAISHFALARHNSFGNPQGSCVSQISMQEMQMAQMGLRRGIHQYMPRMEVPETENIRPSGAFIGGGSSSSGNSVETEINLSSDLDIEELYEHFADQIVEQDWQVDSEVVGGRSATGIWTKSPSAEMELVGMLSVLEVAEGEYELQFRLRVEGDVGGQGSVGISVMRRD